MTPEQFEQKMRFLQSYYQSNPTHLQYKLAECMADTLEKLGYKEGVKYFRIVEEHEADVLSKSIIFHNVNHIKEK